MLDPHETIFWVGFYGRVAPEVPTGDSLVVLYPMNLEEIGALVSESGGEIVKEKFEFPGGNELGVWSD